MSLWRLEWLRLLRTRRLMALLAVYVFFGLTGPLTARYLSQILNGLGGTGGVKVEFPEPRPADGIAQFTSNASQLGLLVVVLVAASALAFDARREMAVFLRTRVRGVRQIVLPAYGVNAGAAVGALLAGALAAWYETVILLGPLPPGRMLLGIACAAMFLVFAVALTALIASLVRGALATAGISLAILLAMAILGSFAGLQRWMPTTLFSALAGLVDGGRPGDYLPAAGVAILASGGALWGAVNFGARREL
jgi:ABC-2 type transport system permease protein